MNFSKMHLVYFIASLMVATLNLACSSDDGDGFSYNFTDPYYTGKGDWTPDEYQLNCSESSCPRAIGVLLFATKNYSYSYSGYTSWKLGRCTAFLTAKDEISTNGHCDKIDSADVTWFKTVATQGYSSETRKVTKSLEKHFTDTGSENAAFSKDYARLKLEKSIDSITPIVLSSTKYIAPTSGSNVAGLETFVVNKASYSEKNLYLDHLNCTMQTNSWHFPPKFSDKPDVFYFYNCIVIGGNSGAPMFAKGDRSTSVAVVQATAYKQSSSLVEDAIVNFRDMTKKIESSFFDSGIFNDSKNVSVSDDLNKYGFATSTYCLGPKSGCQIMSSEKSVALTVLGLHSKVNRAIIKLLEENFDRHYLNSSEIIEYIPMEFTFSNGFNHLSKKSNEVFYIQVPTCLKPGKDLNTDKLILTPLALKVSKMEKPDRLEIDLVPNKMNSAKYEKVGSKFYLKISSLFVFSGEKESKVKFDKLTLEGIDLSKLPVCNGTTKADFLSDLTEEVENKTKELRSKLFQKGKP